MSEQILQADRFLTLWLNGSDSMFVDGIAWTATSTVVWMPLAAALLYAVIRNNDLPSIFLIILSVACSIFIADQVASSLFKPLVARLRPSHDPELMYLIKTVNGYRSGLYGFFSSHASNTFAVATLHTLILRRRQVALILFAWALLNCWTRVYLGVHYVGDLVAGAMFGTMTAGCMFLLYRKAVALLRHQPVRLIRFPACTQSEEYVIACTFLLTCIGIAFKALFFCA